jgi:hypothetical protein
MTDTYRDPLADQHPTSVTNQTTTRDPVADQPIAPTRESRTLDAIDAALAPAFRNAENLGTVSYGELKHALTCIRQALSTAVYGPPEHPTPEPFDALALQRTAAEQERVRVEQEKADGPQPTAESTSGTSFASPPSGPVSGALDPSPYASPDTNAEPVYTPPAVDPAL